MCRSEKNEHRTDSPKQCSSEVLFLKLLPWASKAAAQGYPLSKWRPLSLCAAINAGTSVDKCQRDRDRCWDVHVPGKLLLHQSGVQASSLWTQERTACCNAWWCNKSWSKVETQKQKRRKKKLALPIHNDCTWNQSATALWDSQAKIWCILWTLLFFHKSTGERCVCMKETVWLKKIKQESWARLPQKPPCPFSRASYGEPGLRSTGHWCLLSTRLLPGSHGGCAGEPGPLTTLYSYKSFTPGTEGEQLCSSGETQTGKVNFVDKTST